MFLLKSRWIKRILPHFCYLHSNMFLLKSNSSVCFYKLKLIYIPICFYLNSRNICSHITCRFIYIPICFYLNLTWIPLLKHQMQYLHSNMFLLKFRFLLIQQYVPRNLHSNMFLLKLIQDFIVMLSKNKIYIPICFYLNPQAV